MKYVPCFWASKPNVPDLIFYCTIKGGLWFSYADNTLSPTSWVLILPVSEGWKAESILSWLPEPIGVELSS